MHLLNTTESNAADSICKEIVRSLVQNNKEVKTAPNTNNSQGLSLLPKSKGLISRREERVEITDIKKLISSLGESSCSIEEADAPSEKDLTLSEIPKPSCGRSFQSKEGYESDSDEEQLFDKNHKKKKRRRKRTKCFQNQNKLNTRSLSLTPRALSASEQSHFYGLPNLVQNLSSLGNVQNNIKLILNKVVNKMNKTTDDFNQQSVQKTSIDNRRSDSENSNVLAKETNTLNEYCSLKRKSSTESNKDYLPIKCRRLECDAFLFNEVPEEHNLDTDKNKDKIFGFSSLNPYKSASFTFVRRKNKLTIKKWKSESGMVKAKTTISDVHYNKKTNKTSISSLINKKTDLIIRDKEKYLIKVAKENKEPSSVKNFSDDDEKQNLKEELQLSERGAKNSQSIKRKA